MAPVRADDPMPATKPDHLDRATVTDTGVRVNGMELSFVNYAALLRDFPALRQLSSTAHMKDEDYLRDPEWRAKVDAAIIDSFSYISERQLQLEGIRYTVPSGTFDPKQTTTFYRPPGSNRAAMLDFFGGLVNIKGNGHGGENILKSGTDVQTQVDRYQEVMKIKDPKERDKQLRELRTRDHQDGLMARHEGLGMEVATMRALQMQFDIENAKTGSNHQTVEPYFLLDAPGSDNFFGARFSFVGRQAVSARGRVTSGAEKLYLDEHGGYQSTTSGAVIDAGGFKLLIDPTKHPKFSEAFQNPLLPEDQRDFGKTYDSQQGNAWKNAAQNGTALEEGKLPSRQLAAYYLDVEKLGPIPLDADGNPDPAQLTTEQRKAYEDHGLLKTTVDPSGKRKLEIDTAKLSPFQRDWLAAKKVLIDREKRASALAELKLTDPKMYESLLAKEKDRATKEFGTATGSLDSRAKKANAVLTLADDFFRTKLAERMESAPANEAEAKRLAALAAEEFTGKTGLPIEAASHYAELLLSRAHPDFVTPLINMVDAEGPGAKELLQTIDRTAANGTLRLPVSVYEMLLKKRSQSRPIILKALAQMAGKDPEALRVFASALRVPVAGDLRLLQGAIGPDGKPAPIDLESIAKQVSSKNPKWREAGLAMMRRLLEVRSDQLSIRPNAPLDDATRLAVRTLLQASQSSEDADTVKAANDALGKYIIAVSRAPSTDIDYVREASQSEAPSPLPPRPRAEAIGLCGSAHKAIMTP